ncbi:hypothetical protein MJA45_03185 [Paenibacillus aurantius]|uniref:Uncharacterized protein n=1 Tax=Paenibacillus aurantius TaxID=2918900 RepID=A0AA96LHC5_9BACL|nr:hypothetical protein [Paenibacillus aurantius]WJH36715.1 hypothetical protein N6H14_13860 [Paenibacillus sp. CC-CFT747]WNQ12080.1 hypothetical protein MJA45_03185 [Paenibacillus aurantius]
MANRSNDSKEQQKQEHQNAKQSAPGEKVDKRLDGPNRPSE